MSKKTVTLTLRSLLIEDYDGFRRLQHDTSQLHLPCTQCKAIKKERNRTRMIELFSHLSNIKNHSSHLHKLPLSCRIHLAFLL